MSDVREVLLAMLDEAFDKKAWHGPGLRGAVRRVPPEVAFWRPAPRRHNIWELAIHAAYWKYAVRRRLTGTIKRGSFAMEGSNWIAAPRPADAASWRDAVALLESEQRALRETVVTLPPAALADAAKVRMIHGIAAHDLYHAGQIQLLKRLAPALK